MLQQNYAKFDSRIAESEVMADSMSYAGLSVRTTNPIDSIFDFIWDFMELLTILGSLVLSIFWFFLFVYVLISLFSKWGEKTIAELKALAMWVINTCKWVLGLVFSKCKQAFAYFYMRKKLSVTLIIALVLFNFSSAVLAWNSSILKLSKIESWYVGVDLKNNQVLQPGYHLYSPIKTSYFLSPTNNFDFEIVEVTANTKEDLGVTLDYRVGFKLKDDKRLDFYNTYWAKNIKLVSSDVVMPRLLESIKWIIRDYGFKEISSQHAEIKDITLVEANKVLAPIGIELQDITILDIRLPQSYLASKEDLLKSENELKLAEARLEAQKKENEKNIIEAENLKKIKVIEAEAIAEYNKIITNEKISDAALEMKELEIQRLKIEKWDGTMPTHVEGGFDL